MFAIAFPNLLLYFDVYINKNMSYKFIQLSNLRNYFVYLIAQVNIIIKVNNNNLSDLGQCNFCL